MKQTTKYIFAIVIVLALGVGTYYATNIKNIEENPLATSTPVTYSYPNQVITSLYELRPISENTSLEVWAVTEDSRCPATANCIWAGQVKAALHVGSPMGTSTSELIPGQSVTTETLKITLERVIPEQKLGHKIADDEYQFQFLIEKHNPAAVKPEPKPVTPTPQPTPGPCYVGGCSAHLCSDQPGMASTCEWREQYACYQGETCERQPSGKCGWTPTPELTSCINRTN
jgi:hypothetical protein